MRKLGEQFSAEYQQKSRIFDGNDTVGIDAEVVREWFV